MPMADWDGAGYERISALQRWLAEQHAGRSGLPG